jgi:hypothetical protein
VTGSWLSSNSRVTERLLFPPNGRALISADKTVSWAFFSSRTRERVSPVQAFQFKGYPSAGA